MLQFSKENTTAHSAWILRCRFVDHPERLYEVTPENTDLFLVREMLDSCRDILLPTPVYSISANRHILHSNPAAAATSSASTPPPTVTPSPIIP